MAREPSGDDHAYDHEAYKKRLADDPASGGYPPGFPDWPLEHRNKWFAANTAAILAKSDHLVGRAKVARKTKGNSQPFEPNVMLEASKPAAPEVITRRASDIKPEPIDWLWKYWLARGKLHILAGVPEAGKTTIALSYAAIVSSGDKWPDGTQAKANNVLIWTSEDDAADTLIPRLMRMGANLDRIHIIKETRPPGMKSRPFNPATDLQALVAKAPSAKLPYLSLTPLSRLFRKRKTLTTMPKRAPDCSRL
jgi:hypothetical protein